MRNFDGWTPQGFWRDLKIDVNSLGNLRKVAIVGEKKWQEVMTDILKPFTSADAKYFEEAQAAEAKTWIAA